MDNRNLNTLIVVMLAIAVIFAAAEVLKVVLGFLLAGALAVVLIYMAADQASEK